MLKKRTQGRPPLPPGERKQNQTFRLAPTTLTQLRRLADYTDQTMASVLAAALERAHVLLIGKE